MKKGLSVFLSVIMLFSMCIMLFSCYNQQKIKCIDIKLTNEQYAFGINKENDELLATVNTVIDRIKRDGTLDLIIDKYMSAKEDEYLRVPSGVENPLENQLVVATHTPFSPFEFSRYEAGKGKLYSGIDIEIARIIADEIGAELVIKDIRFDELLTAVNENEADIAMAGITVSSDRQELVNFSSSYYEASQMVIVRADDTTFDGCESKKDVEDILNSLSSESVAAYQNDTTSGLYIMGDESLGFPGYEMTPQGYATPVLAIHALLNGQAAIVVVDESVGKLLVKDINNE